VEKPNAKKCNQPMGRTMKLMAIILTVLFVQVKGNGFTQGNITFSGQRVPLEKVITAIKEQTGYSFFYTEDIWKNAKPVSLNVKNASLKEVLDLIMKDQPISFMIEQTTVILSKKKIENNPPKSFAELPKAPMDIRGKILGENGVALEGVNVLVKGTNNGTRTNASGEFLLKEVDENAMLSISSAGYDKLDVAVKGKVFITAQLKINLGNLDEVQVIGYGTTTKRYNTGNVTTIKADAIAKQPVQNPLLALQGRVAGLLVLQTSGISGSSIRVRIQGQNSLGNGNEPLYVIDGVPIISQLPMTGVDAVLAPTGANYSGFGNPLNYLNLADIESIEVLKDADATSIYGSRAANGAILITTKKGKAGPMKLDLNLQAGIGQVAKRLDMLNTRQYLDMRYEAFRNDGINWKDQSVSANDLKVWDTTRYTDWQKVLIGNTARYTTVNANLSGGTSTVQYLFGAAYNKATTVFPIPKDFADTKISLSSSLVATSANQKFKIQFTGSYTFDKNQLPRFDFTQSALLQEPNAPSMYNQDGSINWAPDANGNSTFGSNPMISTVAKYWNKTDNLLSNMVLSYRLNEGLEIKGSAGYNKLHTDDLRTFPLVAAPPELRQNPGTQRSGEYGSRNINSWIVEPQINYKTKVGYTKIELMIGGTLLHLNTDVTTLKGTGHLSDELLENINGAAVVANQYSSKSEYKYNAGFGRINVNWLDKYLLNLTARRDGSSRFGAENQFQNFGSIGAGWLFSNEQFSKKTPWLSFGKIKASYGTTGNDQIGDYRFLSLYNYPPIQIPYQGVVSIMPSSLPNPHLQWEETKKLQIGVELGFMKDRFLFNATYARNRSSNQLLNYTIPIVAGFSNYLTNFPAVVQNKNWEFVITSKNITGKAFSWTTNFNVTLPKNQLLSFPDLKNSSDANQLVVGKPVTIQRLVHYIGVDPGSGAYYFSSKTNPFNPLYPDDYTSLVNIDPKFYGGMQNILSYKGLELDVLFQFVKQVGYNDLNFWNGNRTPGSFFGGLSNQPVTVLSRWQASGLRTPISKFSTDNLNNSPIISSDYRYTDASFIRIKNVSLAWDLPQKWARKVGMSKCRIYVHGQNLFTITHYKGLDPENQSILSPTLPPLRVIMVGVQVNF
jgi:TonB-linked SusC/RagA family outer membrane protein